MTRRPPSAPKRRTDELLHCRHFGTCGGCSLLDQPIQWQVHDKVEAAERLLAPFLNGNRIECAETTWTPRHFRARLLYPVRGDRDDLCVLGIYAFRSHELVRIEECRTQDTWLTAFGRAAERVLREQRLRPFHPDSGRGVVKALWARLASGTGQVLAGVVTKPGVFAQGPALATALVDAARALPAPHKPRKLVGVVHSISDRDDEFLLGDRHVPLRGTDHIVDRRDDLTFRISAGSFYQVHAEADELLYRPVLAMAGDMRGKHVVDGYGGVGAFGLRFCKRGARVTIIEENAVACRDAEHNAAVNELRDVTVVKSAFAGAVLPPEADLLVVDPPRSGLQQKACSRVLAGQPQRVLYVSCSAESLARDLEALQGAYRLVAIRLCDLFPHTEHVELAVLLERVADPA